jgi:hypothetical protein
MKTLFALCFVFIFSFAGLTYAQERQLTLESPVSEQRVALVIGNSAYEVSPLKNPVNDARDVAQTLTALGFQVIHKDNLNQVEMKRVIRDFGEKIKNGGVGLFYFAGHGVQVNGANYLIPVGAVIEKQQEVEYEAVDVGFVLAQMENAKTRMNIVILDACRNNPFARSFRSESNGLASINAPSGTLIAYATAPGSVASDGDGKNGLFTQELLFNMRTIGLGVEDVFKRARSSVREKTQGKQTPWESSSLVGDFYFTRADQIKQAPNTQITIPSMDAMLQAQPTKSVPQTKTDTANAIATKDIGSLRVVLKSIMRVNLKDGWNDVNGIRCSFEFINLETQKPIVIAMNATAPDQAMNHLSATMGSYLRSTLVAENGGLWRLRYSDVGGMTVVGVGQQRFPGPYYNPAEIVTALSRRDDGNSDVSRFTYGTSNGEYRFIFGSMTEMSPGQSLTVTLNFVQDGNRTNSDAPPKVFQMATEIVVGIVKTGTKKSYTLYNLTFDEVSLPSK